MVAIRITTGVLVVSLVGSIMLTGALTRLLRLQNATWLRATGVVLVISLLGMIAFVAHRFLAGTGYGGVPLDLAYLLFSIAMPLMVYGRAYTARGWKLAAFFGLQVVLSCLAFGTAIATKVYVAEAFVISANSMAPGLYGRRQESVCPKCGGTAVRTHLSDDEEGSRIYGDDTEPCLRCGTPIPFDRAAEIHSADRIIVEKIGVPRRWELAAFLSPEDSSTTYVKRLVGLPGETIVIRDGFVYADGRKLEPPPEAGPLRYLSDYDGFGLDYRDPTLPDPLWGDPEKPMKLGSDEYFFLGDHTRRSLDCRFYGPVRREALVGTASLIYWPPERWKILK